MISKPESISIVLRTYQLTISTGSVWVSAMTWVCHLHVHLIICKSCLIMVCVSYRRWICTWYLWVSYFWLGVWYNSRDQNCSVKSVSWNFQIAIQIDLDCNKWLWRNPCNLLWFAVKAGSYSNSLVKASQKWTNILIELIESVSTVFKLQNEPKSISIGLIVIKLHLEVLISWPLHKTLVISQSPKMISFSGFLYMFKWSYI